MIRLNWFISLHCLEDIVMDYGQILGCTAEYLNVEDLKALRLCNKNFNAIAGPLLTSKVSFIVTEDQVTLKCLQNSCLKFNSIVILSCDAERLFLGRESQFLAFRKQFCSTITSLHLKFVRLGMGRFVELVSYCPNLKEVSIIKCKDLLRSDGILLLNWWAFMPLFMKHMSMMKSLVMVDDSLTDEIMLSITGPMKKLQSLQISSGKASFPILGVTSLVSNCSNSLNLIRLRTEVQNPFLDKEAAMNFWNLFEYSSRFSYLKIFSVERLFVWNASSFSSALSKMTFLEELELIKMFVKQGMFTDLERLRNLKRLRIADCFYEQGSLSPLKKSSSLEALYVSAQAKAMSEFQNSIVQRELREYFSCDNAVGKLKHINLRGFPAEVILTLISVSLNIDADGENKFNIHCNLPLQTLTLNLLTFKPYHFMSLRFFSMLETLSLAGCDLTDDTMRILDKSNLLMKLVTSLQSLKSISLSSTGVGDLTVEKWIVNIPKLAYVDLSNTKITKSGLQILISNIQYLPSLRGISLKFCPMCTLNKTMLSLLKAEIPDVIVKF